MERERRSVAIFAKTIREIRGEGLWRKDVRGSRRERENVGGEKEDGTEEEEMK